jgi:hypothetical protein
VAYLDRKGPAYTVELYLLTREEFQALVEQLSVRDRAMVLFAGSTALPIRYETEDKGAFLVVLSIEF